VRQPVKVHAKAASADALFNKENAIFEVFARDNDTTEINLYDEIGGWFGVTAKQFRQQLDGVKSSKIILNINSPGGDVFDGIAIYNDLLAHKAYVVVRVTGLAASAASLIAMAGDEVQIADNAFFMIHNAWSVAVGDAQVMKKRAGLLSKIDAELGDTYAARTGGDADDIREQMNEETWLNADEAVEQGFADQIISADEKADAKASFDLAPFKNVPKALKPRRMANKAKTEEKPKPAAPVEDFSSLVAAMNDGNSRLAALISQI
jgi:ATP-dependent Clp protease protease subunit